MSDRNAQPMNLLHVISDQHMAALLACAEHPQAITPNMDRLAAKGVRFTNAYAQNPICTPSRVSILSGQYCHNHGYYGLSGPTPHALPSLLGHMKQHGYRTAAFGKLHMPCDPVNWLQGDLDRFGDSYETSDGKLGDSKFLSYLEGAGVRQLEDSWHNPHHYGPTNIAHDAMPSELPYEHTQEVWSAREAIKFIDEAPDQPFAIQVAFQKPHHPLLPQQKFWDMYPEDIELPATFEQDPSHRPPHFQQMFEQLRNRTWEYAKDGESYVDGARRAWRGTLACVTQVDDVLGMLISALEERGLDERTILVYNSDHGCYHTAHGIIEKAPGISSDAVCRVPMIWYVPGLTKSGHVSDQLVENIDLPETITSLCQLRGEDKPVRDVAVTENAWSKSMRWGKWRFVYYDPEMFDEPTGELYDIENDPNETTNLFHDPAHRELVESCRHRLLSWLIRTTRITTGQPRPKDDYRIAGDNRESNQHGPAARLARGQLNYL